MKSRRAKRVVIIGSGDGRAPSRRTPDAMPAGVASGVHCGYHLIRPDFKSLRSESAIWLLKLPRISACLAADLGSPIL